MASAFFAGPKKDFQRGGAHIALHLVPVHNGRLVAFDVTATGLEGRWLPWTVLEFRGNPYADAAALADDWCQGDVTDLRLVDVLSNEAAGSWELAIIFRAELSVFPAPDGPRAPIALAPPFEEPLNGLPPVELERWLGMGPPAEAAPEPEPPRREIPRAGEGPKLVF